MNEVPQSMPTEPVQEQPSPQWSTWVGLIGVILTLLVYWISHGWNYWDWSERGPEYGNPIARQIYEQWIFLRCGELGLVFASLLLITYAGRRSWHPIIAVGLSCMVMAIWVLWFYQPVKCGASLPGFCVPLY